jgi:hypothetical protein
VVLPRDVLALALDDLELGFAVLPLEEEEAFDAVRRVVAAMAALATRQIARTRLRNLLTFKPPFYTGAQGGCPAREPQPVHGV